VALIVFGLGLYQLTLSALALLTSLDTRSLNDSLATFKDISVFSSIQLTLTLPAAMQCLSSYDLTALYKSISVVNMAVKLGQM